MPLSSAIKRHGGKAYMAREIRALFPPHTRYCEPFFGSGAVMLAGDGEGVAEYANDLDGDLSNFWATLRDPETYPELLRRLSATPFSKHYYEHADMYRDCSPVTRAEAFFIRNRQSRQALGRDFATPTSRLRRGMNEQVSAWLSAVDGLPQIHARLRRVEIRCMDAVDFIRELDSPATLFYCDPPYMRETRFNGGGEYGQHEMTDGDHAKLLDVLGAIEGKFVLSGYPNPLYDDYADRKSWRYVDFLKDNKASSAKAKEKKTERVWMNFAEANP